MAKQKKVQPIGTFIEGVVLAIIGVSIVGASWPRFGLSDDGTLETQAARPA